jgi:peroxiredoxin
MGLRQYSIIKNTQFKGIAGMIEQKQRSIMKLAVMIFIIAAGVYALVLVHNTKSNTPAPSIKNNETAVKTEEPNNGVQNAPAVTTRETGTGAEVEPSPEKNLWPQDIVRLRRTWGPILASWYGEDAPDFTLTDLVGKEHKLSDYRGRNVLLTFWTTWCRPCLEEIPSLMALRSMIGEDKLAILAISNEPVERVKRFAQVRQLNYTVFSYDTLLMGRPYNQTMGIPTSFFIDPQGKIKIITEGTLPFNDIRAILETK